MSKYIDAERLKQILKPSEWGTPDERWIPEHEIGAMLDYFPTADVVEVVRCKDCKHSEHWYGDKRRCFLWHEDGIDVFETGYCSYVERKNG